jgi:hypothetical protein
MLRPLHFKLILSNNNFVNLNSRDLCIIFWTIYLRKEIYQKQGENNNKESYTICFYKK